MFCADPTFGLNHQTHAILTFLAASPRIHCLDLRENEVRSVILQTFPWYNGYENGAAIVLGAPTESTDLIVVFGERSSSDSIFIEDWVRKAPTPRLTPVQPPTIEARDQEALTGVTRTTLPYGQVGEACAEVIRRMKEFYHRYPR